MAFAFTLCPLLLYLNRSSRAPDASMVGLSFTRPVSRNPNHQTESMLESKKVLAVLEDLFFTVKINESAKRAGMGITFVKSEHDALEQAKTQPGAHHPGSEFPGIDPLNLIRKLKADEHTKGINLLGVPFARPGRAKAAGAGSRLQHGAGALGVFAEPAPDPEAPRRLTQRCPSAAHPIEIRRQLPGDLVRHIRARAAKLRAVAFLRCRPDHVAVFVHQPHRRQRFVLALMDVGGVLIAHADTQAIGRRWKSAWSATLCRRRRADPRCPTIETGRCRSDPRPRPRRTASARSGFSVSTYSFAPCRLAMIRSRICAAVSPPVSRST